MGLHTAVELARRGLAVVATMRDTSRSRPPCTDAATEAGVELDVRALDVTDHEAARACVDGVLADHGRIDVLVNNAGRGAVATAEQLSLDEIRDQLEVNYLGPVALTKLVLPHMRAAGSGTVLTVTSVGGAVGQPFADAYCGAKFAVEGFMQSLAVVMLAHGVHVSVIEPAAVASDFVGNVARPEGDPADPYAAQLDAYLARSAGAFANAQSSRDAAVAIADAATSAELPLPLADLRGRDRLRRDVARRHRRQPRARRDPVLDRVSPSLESATVSYRRPVPTIGDPSSAAERAQAPDAWALRDDLASLERVVGARRDIRRFRPDPVPDDVLTAVLTAGHRGPSVGHSQPWRFVVVTEAATRDTAALMADRCRLRQAAGMAEESARGLLDLRLEGIREAPVGVVVACDRRTPAAGVLGRATFPDADLWSCAAAIENIWLTARAHGLGLGWVTLFEPAELADLLGLPDGVETLGWLCLGWPDERPPEPGLERAGWSRRLPLEQVVMRERWTERDAPTSHLRAPEPADVVAARDRSDDLLTVPGLARRPRHRPRPRHRAARPWTVGAPSSSRPPTTP